MLVIPVQELAEPFVRRRPDGSVTRQYAYLGIPHHRYAGEPSREAQAFLVEMQPATGAQIRPHFHPTPQFQVIVGGSGRLGRHRVGPYDFHYADARTVYGPIVPDPDGIAFMTLRRCEIGVTWWMPDDRGERRRGRNLVVPLERGGARTPGITTLIEPHDDGLVAHRVLVAPDEEVMVPDHAGGGDGQYRLVIGGGVRSDAQRLAERSLMFLPGPETTLPVAADGGGAELLVMQFPRLEEG